MFFFFVVVVIVVVSFIRIKSLFYVSFSFVGNDFDSFDELSPPVTSSQSSSLLSNSPISSSNISNASHILSNSNLHSTTINHFSQTPDSSFDLTPILPINTSSTSKNAFQEKGTPLPFDEKESLDDLYKKIFSRDFPDGKEKRRRMEELDNISDEKEKMRIEEERALRAHWDWEKHMVFAEHYRKYLHSRFYRLVEVGLLIIA
jgi:hypothetical protein